MISQISAAPVDDAGFECGQLFLIACILRNKWAVGRTGPGAWLITLLEVRDANGWEVLVEYGHSLLRLACTVDHIANASFPGCMQAQRRYLL